MGVSAAREVPVLRPVGARRTPLAVRAGVQLPAVAEAAVQVDENYLEVRSAAVGAPPRFNPAGRSAASR
jgi:hypothetical protein